MQTKMSFYGYFAVFLVSISLINAAEDERDYLKVIDDRLSVYSFGGTFQVTYKVVVSPEKVDVKIGSANLSFANTDVDTSGSSPPPEEGGIGSLKLKWTPTGGDFKTVELSLGLAMTPDGSWSADNGTVDFEPNPSFTPPQTGVDVYTDMIDAARGFSFSCSDLQLRNTLASNVSTVLSLKRFQLQPFRTNATVFADSFDCSSWFTIPMWMGFIVILFFTIVIATAVTMLANIKTMDRFENPKGKTITVPTTD